MPTTLIENADTWPVDFAVPADGEDADEASITPPFQRLLDRTAWLRRRLLGYGTQTNHWFTVPLILAKPTTTFEVVEGGGVGMNVSLMQKQIGGVALVMLPSLFAATFIKEVVVWCRGRTPHSALPGFQPRVELRYDTFDGPSVLVASTQRNWGSPADYHAGGTIELTMNEVVVQNRCYYLRIVGEAESNSHDEGFEVGAIAIRTQGQNP